jgi:hypothetical protein
MSESTCRAEFLEAFQGGVDSSAFGKMWDYILSMDTRKMFFLSTVPKPVDVDK